MTDIAEISTITLSGAWKVIGAGVAEAEARGSAVVIAVVDPGGHLQAMVRMDHAPVFSLEVARKKAWTAAAARTATAELAEALESVPLVIDQITANVDDLLVLGGGVPIVVDGELVGAVGVSGATTEEDHEIACEAADVIEVDYGD